MNSEKRLTEYRKKRNFDHTQEPIGKISKKSIKHLIFTIQKHAARRLHYDLRLEYNGVLKSWAIPKGPSLSPDDKRLAVQVEDHPLDYATFEGNIPKDEYGAGAVLLWDKGYWTPEGDVARGLKQGKLLFSLHGEKLQGKWALLLMHNDSKKKNWLLIKLEDKDAQTKRKQANIVDRKPKSVLSDRTIKEIATDNGKKQINHIELSSLGEDAPFPEIIAPELATLSNQVPQNNQWLHEVKFDGYRILTQKKNDQTRLLTRNKHDWTKKMPSIAKALNDLQVNSVIFDGEVITLDEKGLSNFQLLQNVLKNSQTSLIIYCIFDVLYWNGRSLLNVPLIQRKKVLQKILNNCPPILFYVDHVQGEGQIVFGSACECGLEGIISKRLDSYYIQKRTRDWLKNKCYQEQEFVIGGYSKPRGKRRYFGALLLGYYDKDQHFMYCGRVGTGFTEETLKNIYQKIKTIRTKNSPFLNALSNAEQKDVTWVKPHLVTQISLTEWTKEGRLRHPSFKGLRSDKPPQEVKKEMPEKTKDLQQEKNEKDIDHFHLTHPEKIIYEKLHLTKYDIASLYFDLADWILPYISNRPLMIMRCPEGIQKSCFYQKHPNESLSQYIKTVEVIEKNAKENYLTIHSTKGLLALVQMDVLEIHAWGSKNDAPNRPDRLIFDLDPALDVPWQAVIQGAQQLHSLLLDLGLKNYVKTSGGKGLHVVSPIIRKISWDDLKQFSKSIVIQLEKHFPQQYIAVMTKKKRQGKIFIDYLRNGQGATTVAPYSLRAREDAPLSVPLTWEELPDCKSPSAFDATNIRERLTALKKDPWQGFFECRQTITSAMLKKVNQD
jgi:bifunctional non-homologous end joining protein LigD